MNSKQLLKQRVYSLEKKIELTKKDYEEKLELQEKHYNALKEKYIALVEEHNVLIDSHCSLLREIDFDELYFIRE